MTDDQALVPGAVGSPALAGRGLSKQYGNIRALKNTDFTSYYGKIVGLIGDNGAGKSTLVKVLVGVERSDTGTVQLDGKDQSWSSAAQVRAAGVETVFQDLALCGELSVWRNFYLNREPRLGRLPFGPLNRTAMRDGTAAAMADFGLRLKTIEGPVTALSGGERQGLAIARAVHFGARVLIMDEPTNALSVYETEKVLESMDRAVRAGLAVIVISHTLAHIHQMADEIAVMQHAQCVARIKKGELSLLELEDIVAGRSPAVRR